MLFARRLGWFERIAWHVLKSQLLMTRDTGRGDLRLKESQARGYSQVQFELHAMTNTLVISTPDGVRKRRRPVGIRVVNRTVGGTKNDRRPEKRKADGN